MSNKRNSGCLIIFPLYVSLDNMMVQKKIDKYILYTTQRLGKGSFAQVFKGKLVDGTREFAIKVVDKKLLKKDEYLRSALFNQIGIMKKVKSQNVVKLEQVLETPNNYYIIQQYCNSGTLREYLNSKDQTQQVEALKMLKDILAGFLPLVKYGIIHRDLKPENILIHNGVLKIADFGFAKSLHNFTRQMMDSTVGTPLYMSPQILREERYSTKSDVWSIGLIYYQIIHGVHPYNSRSEKELLKKIQTKKVQYSALLSTQGKDFISKCLGATEQSRQSWDQLYRHPYVADSYRAYIKEEDKLEDRALFIINELRMKIHESNLNLESLFKTLNSSKDGFLSKRQLYKLLMNIDKGITKQEVIYVFNKFDKDGSNTIQFAQFKQWLEQNQIKLKHHAIPKNVVGVISQDEAFAIRALQILKQSVQMLKIDLLQFFKKFGKKDKDQLQLKDFQLMMHKINKQLKPEQLQVMFKKFDTNGDQKITFDEFKGLLHKISGRPILDEFFKKNLQDALKNM